MADVERFVSDLGEVVKQDTKGLISSVKDSFSEKELQSFVRRSITKGIADCQLDRDKKAEENRVVKGSSLAKKIRELTNDIKGTLDCNKLQQEVKKVLDSFEDAVKDGTKVVQEKLDEILPIAKVPTSPTALPKYVKKATVGRVLPDLEATIDFIKRTVELISAINELVKVVNDIDDRIEACAMSTVKMITGSIRNSVDGAVNDLKMSIEDGIAAAICNGLQEAGIKANNLEDALSAYSAIKSLTNGVKELQNNIETSLGESVAKIGAKQADLQDLTGVPPVLDTTSLDAFLGSASSPEYEQYKQSVTEVFQQPEPVNSEQPIISGNPAVGQTLTCSEGVWTANGVASNAFSFSYQWMRQGAEIYGANTNQYTPIVNDISETLYCRVRAENQFNLEEVMSAATPPIQFAMLPGNAPVITGTAQVGQTLTCSDGTWPFTPDTIQFEWIRVVSPGANVRVQSLSSNNTYYCKTADIGSSIKCKVVATSFKYTLSAESANTEIVIA